MTARDFLQLALFLSVSPCDRLSLLGFLCKGFQWRETFLHGIFGRIENLIYRFSWINPGEDQEWTTYAGDLMAFSLVTCVLTYVVLRFQSYLPLNPQHFANLSPHLAFNTAVSFTTNTNWQSYGGESTMSYSRKWLD